MDTRHLTFLRRNGVDTVDTYNNYFNRDNKKTLLVPLEFMTMIFHNVCNLNVNQKM